MKVFSALWLTLENVDIVIRRHGLIGDNFKNHIGSPMFMIQSTCL